MNGIWCKVFIYIIIRIRRGSMTNEHLNMYNKAHLIFFNEWNYGGVYTEIFVSNNNTNIFKPLYIYR